MGWCTHPLLHPLAAEAAGGRADQSAEALPESVRAERRLLHAVFQQAPVPLFLLEQDGTIRRANNEAAALLGSPTGYATGKPLTAFVDLPFRATVQTQLAAVARTGRQRTAGCRLLSGDGPVDVMLTAAAADLPGDPSVRIVTATRTAVPAVAGEPQRDDKPAKRPAAKAKGDPAIAAMTRRLDAVTAVTRVLLDNSTFSEAVTLQRCARLLAGEIADWVLIDIDRGGRLLRQFAAGPRAAHADQLARVVRGVDPDQESLPALVHSAGKSVLLAHPDDPAAEPKAVAFGPRFAASRPSADPAAGVREAWGEWLDLAGGDDRDLADPGAIIARRELPDGRLWGTTSVTLVALAPDRIRYDFQASPGSGTGWYPVRISQ